MDVAKIHVLHFHDDWGAGAIRVQRFVHSELNMGIQPVIFVKREEDAVRRGLDSPPSSWIPQRANVPVEYFKPSRQLSYLLPTLNDQIGLKKVFNKHKCDFVHAHNVGCAYYSHKIGHPTLYDDWEYNYEYFDYQKKSRGKTLAVRSAGSAFLSLIRRIRAKSVVRELLQKLPVIVTNDEVEFRYRQLGAKSIWWIPNVPLSYEKEYAFAVKIEKRNKITTCYVGSMSADEDSVLRNTSGVKRLWSQHDIGDLLVLEGMNRVPHLDVLRKLRECHFNLLYWKPLPIHRYFVQNKAFLASVVGVPTIISSSLKATIKLLGEYALPVRSLEEIPRVIKTYDHFTKYRPNPTHTWECFQPKIRAAYEKVLQEGQPQQ